MLLIAGHIDFDPGCAAELASRLKDLETETRAEEGCIYYAMSMVHLGHVTVLEQWRDERCLEAHLATRPLKDFIADFTQHLRNVAVFLYDVSGRRRIEVDEDRVVFVPAPLA